jgi:hypothetical protein
LTAKLDEMRAYVPTQGSLASAGRWRLGAVIDGWMAENGLECLGAAVLDAMEEFYGVVPCADEHR